VSTTRVALVAFVALAAGCATRTPPLTSLAGRNCDDAVDLASATPLPLDAEKPFEARVGAEARCIRTADGAEGAYLLFELPRSAGPFHVVVESLTVGKSLFAPQVTVLDARGRAGRGLEVERFNTRGTTLQGTLFFEAVASERYLLVTSLGGHVGTSQTRRMQSIRTTPVFTGYVSFVVSHGAEAERAVVYAHNGHLRLHARSNPH